VFIRPFFLYVQKSAYSFWQHYPACLYGLAFFLGSQFAFEPSRLILFPAGLLLLSLCMQPIETSSFERLALASAIAAFAFFWTSLAYPSIEIPPDGIKGEGVFEIESLVKRQKHFGSQWIYKGNIHYVSEHDKANGISKGKNLPVSIQVMDKPGYNRPLADRSYLLTGTLKAKGKGSIVFQTAHDSPWQSIEGSWSCAEFRYKLKKGVSELIRRHISNGRNANFLSGIATGDFDDRLMSYEMGRFGLQHIMAISGFHFSVFATLLSVIFSCLFSRRTTVCLMVISLSSYFCFLGCTASVMRAWIMILIPLAGALLHRQGSGVNSLGVALFIVLAFDPLMGKSLGFQFSFLTTAGILLLYPGCDLFMQKIVPKRALCTMIEMHRWDQHAYCVLAWFRQGVSLSLAVNAVALPLMLVYFQKFPLMSLVYNLFFPFMVSGSLLLLFLGLFFGCFSEVAGAVVHGLNNIYTGFLLDLTYNLPPVFDCVFRLQSCSEFVLVMYLSLLLVFGMVLHYWFVGKQEELQDYSFI
jgi:competence protein ComEC